MGRAVPRREDVFLRDADLRRLYERTRGPVAFVDESYRLPGARGEGFYTMTGVLFDREELVENRRRMLAVGRTTGGGPWHTTEAYEDGRHEQITRVVGAVAQRASWSIVTAEVPMKSGALRHEIEARNACLRTLLIELTRGADPAQLIVTDHRTIQGDADDRKLSAQLRGAREIPEHTLLRHSSDTLEPLLTAPDAISWATRRLLDLGETRWVEPAADAMTLIHTTTGERVDVAELLRKHNSAGQAVAIPTPDHENRLQRSGRNSSLLPPSVSHDDQASSRQKTPLEELANRARAVRERSRLADQAKSRGVSRAGVDEPEHRTGLELE